MKRGNLGLVVALVFMFIISGCSGSKKSEGSWQGGEVSLDLWGFPSTYSSYNLEIYAHKNDTLLQTYNLGKVSGRYQGKITVSSEATSLTAYLINNDKCNFFWYLPTQNNSFKSSYWIDYDYFINQGYIRYGVSEDLARTISPNFIGVADFNQAPYYLYKLTAIRDQNLSITATSQSDERIALSLGSLVNNLEFISCYTNVSKYFPNCTLDDMFVLVHPDSYITPVKADVNFTTKFSIKSIDTHIYGIAAGNSPNRMYAVGGGKRYELYYLNPLIGNIERTFSLPFEPRRVKYSASDNKLYITGTYSDNILIWDIANSTYSIVDPNFSITSEIVVASKLRKIFITGSSGIRVINMDDPSIINTISLNVRGIAIDENRNKVYVSKEYSLACYSFDGKNLTLDKEVQTQGNLSDKLVLSPDGTRLVRYMLRGWNSSTGMIMYNITDLSKMGQWGLKDQPTSAVFHPNNRLIYVTIDDSDESSLYVLDSRDFTIYQKLPFPNAGYSPCFDLNSDSSIMTCYSDDFNYSNQSNFYFLPITDNNSSNLLKSFYNKEIIQKLPSKNALKYICTKCQEK